MTSKHRRLLELLTVACVLGRAVSGRAQTPPGAAAVAPTPAPTSGATPASAADHAAAPEPSSGDRDEPFEPEDALVQRVSVTSRLSQRVQLAPAAVTVITREQILENGYTSVGEALASVPGIFVSYDLQNYQVAVRGLSGGTRGDGHYLKIMIDGRPFSFVFSGGYFLGPEFIPMSAVERIEVMRGPASALYGTGALVAAVNVVTRRPAYEGQPSAATTVFANGAAGSARAVGGDFSQTYVSQDWFVLAAFSGTYENRSGLAVPSTSPFVANGTLVDPSGRVLRSSGDTAYPGSVLLRVEKTIGDGRITALAAGQLHDYAAEFYDLAPFTGNTRISLANAMANVGYELPFSSGVSILANAGFAMGEPAPGDRIDLQIGDRLDNANLRLLPVYYTRDFGYEEGNGQLEVRYDLQNGGWLLGGLDGAFDYVDVQSYTEVDRVTGAAGLKTPTSSQQLGDVGAYGQALYPVFDWLRLSGQVRFDYETVYGSTFAARGGAVVPVSDALTFKLLAGRSFKGPSPEELYGRPVSVTVPDINGVSTLRPQYMNGGDAIVDWFVTRWLYVDVGTFADRYDGIIAYTRVANTLSPTAFNATGYGAEFSVRVSKPIGSVTLEPSLLGSYTYLATDEGVFAGLPQKAVPDNEGVPTVMAGGQLQVSLASVGLSPFLRYEFVGERTPTQSNLVAAGTTDMRYPSYTLPPYGMVDVGMSTRQYDLGAGTGLGGVVRVTNLLDQRFTEIGYNGVDIPGLGRTGWVQLRLTM